MTTIEILGDTVRTIETTNGLKGDTGAQGPQGDPGPQYLAADTLLPFDGSGGTSGIKYNSTTSKIELFVNGVKKAEWG